MAASHRQVNIRAAGFTPTGGTLTTFTGVTDLAINTAGNLLKFSGDGDRFPTVTINDFSDPSITITCADYAAMAANSIGTRGVFSAVLKDARNQSATSAAGDITIAMSTAVVGDIPFTQSHRQFGKGTVIFGCESVDGLTSPLSLTVA